MAKEHHDRSRTQAEHRKIRQRLQMVFQSPYASLNPRWRVGSILAEPLRVFGLVQSPQAEIHRIHELLEQVGLSASDAARFPHEFSGGQRQRISIARALASRPEFIVCDEAVSALDVSIQAQILNLLQDLQETFKLTYLFITHDLSVVRHIADRVCAMFLGKAVELAPTQEIFQRPRHPYTRFLMSAVPIPNPRLRGRQKMILKGEIPSPIDLPTGCRFHTRCPYAQSVCQAEDPPFIHNGERSVACHFPLD